MHSVLVLILISWTCVANAEIYSSFIHLIDSIQSAINADELDDLKRYIREETLRASRFREVLREYGEVSELIKSEQFRSSHPISALKFIRQFEGVVTKLQDITNGSVRMVDIRQLKNRGGRSPVPDRDDFNGMVSSLMRLQDMHFVTAADMASGNILGFKTTPLSTMECLDMARTAQRVYNGLNAPNARSFKAFIAIEWLDVAESKVSTLQEANYFIQVSNEVYKAVHCECTSDNLDRREYFEYTYPDLNVTSDQKCSSRKAKRCKSFSSRSNVYPDNSNFYALCRGETVQTSPELEYPPTMKHKLRCRNVHNNDPGLLFRPVKYEELNLAHPRMAILHEIIDDQEIEKLKDTARPHLKRGTIRQMVGQVVSDKKVSKQYFIPLNICKEIIPNLRRRLAGVTGLSLKSFEKIQVVNYGTGGFYTIHLDLFTPNVLSTYSEITNNRLATMVIYLGDVAAGGETAFPQVGLTVKPKKGNAFLFFNLKRNGELIHNSLHSSCPIIYGEKWIANQWVGRNGQEFSYQCSLDKTL